MMNLFSVFVLTDSVFTDTIIKTMNTFIVLTKTAEKYY